MNMLKCTRGPKSIKAVHTFSRLNIENINRGFAIQVVWLVFREMPATDKPAVGSEFKRGHANLRNGANLINARPFVNSDLIRVFILDSTAPRIACRQASIWHL